jgi:GT2 family glycosyltransferase
VPAELVIPEPEEGYPAGWILIQGDLRRWGGDYDAHLYYDLGDGYVEERSFQIPTSGKGAINEVVLFPAGIKRLKLSPMRSAGEFEFSGLTLLNIGTVERIWRMARRVMAMCWVHPKRKRKLIKLSRFRMFSDLQGAYLAANKLRVHAAAPPYRDWIAEFDAPDANEAGLIERHLARSALSAHFNVVVIAEGDAHDAVQKTLLSLDTQLYRGCTTTVLAIDAPDQSRKGEDAFNITQGQMPEWMGKFNRMLADGSRQEWVIILQAGDVLAPHALYWFASEVSAKPGAAIIYADDDELDASGQRCKPRFKPDWSLTHLRATNFIGDAAVLRGSEVAAAGGVSIEDCRHGNYDLLLRVIDQAGDAGANSVAHIPAVLLHRMHCARAEKEGDVSRWYAAALRAHLARNGVAADVLETRPECWRVRFRLTDAPPLVSIIVPTRDGLALIRQCVESLLAKTTYPRFEILVVDNQSADPEALAYLAEIAGRDAVRVLRYDRPFNYSAINNFAVREARGAVLCLLNNDTEVISPDWLEEMVGQLLQPKVGVVGAKLYFPNGQIQHAGDLVGVGGVANHAHAFLRGDDAGYCNRAVVAQELSAVTAACLLTWKPLYRELDGLDEVHLAVAFNDVDFCLRVREAGYRVVWTPHAELYHHESVSRGKDSTPAKKRRAKREATYMRKRWKKVLRCDPFYNPNLSYERPDFSLSHAPLVEKPWLEWSVGGRELNRLLIKLKPCA